MKKQDKLQELIRTVVRATAFLIPLLTLCGAVFVLTDVREILVGAIIGASTSASIFYFEKPKD